MIMVGQTVSIEEKKSQIKYLEREEADQYTLSKKGFTAVYEHKKTYYSINERFKLYRRKIVADVTKNQSSNKPLNLENISEIRTYDFDKLQHKKFTAYKGDFKYELYQFNKEFFMLEVFYNYSENDIKKDWKYYSSELVPFEFIQLKDKKKILTLISHTHLNYIVPKKDTLELKIWTRYQAKGFVPLNFSETQSYTPTYDSKKLYLISSHLHQLGNYYHIITEKGKKRLYNYRGEDVLQKRYDSIVLSNFIIGFKGKKYDVYNQTFKKLKLPKLQAVHLDRSNRYNLQVIQNNELRSIPLSNDTSEKYVVTNPTPPFMPTLNMEIAYKIEDRATEYAFISEFTLDTLTIPKNNIKDIYFLKNRKKKIVTDTEIYIIAELTNGNFNLFDFRKPNTNLLVSMSEIEHIGGFIRFKKDNLYGYFKIHTKGRYIKLDHFQGFFARFELPNGKKGWLDRNGKEYLNL
ncbi:hypothetical protein IMCC3317_24140 [Kordia antarctica]|uniref:Uncharacterized protein n=2 Tax=Kordia antarctica TaxID=1218801 RepID=A0A7L4ZLH3_9FLAO|nr:hypothetical protein IMCC3317_24140 [Kordia antarctica]